MEQQKKKSNHKKENQSGKTFRSKHINHDPQAESARAVFGVDQNRAENKQEPRA